MAPCSDLNAGYLMIELSFLDDLDLDRKFLTLSASMSNIFSWTYGMLGGRLIAPIDPNEFDNASSKLAEIGVRTLIVLGAIASFCLAGAYLFLGAVVLSAGSKIFRGLGCYFQKQGFTHIRGSAPEKKIETGHAKIMQWNIRGYGGSLIYKEGGVIHWSSRVDRILDCILTEDPDILLLQDVLDPLLFNEIVNGLEYRFAHFFGHLGTNIWSDGSGTLVISKCAVHTFSHTDFTKTDEKVKRGFETLEIKANSDALVPMARIIATQLSPGGNAFDTRMSQMGQIIDTLAREKIAMPTFFVGSLNVDRDSIEGETLLAPYVHHSYLSEVPTHSDKLESKWSCVLGVREESSSFISLFKRNPINDCRIFPVVEKGIRLIGSHLDEGYDQDYSTKYARSDYHAVVTEVDGLRVN